MPIFTILFAAFTSLAWIGWLLLMAGTAAITADLNKTEEFDLSAFDGSGFDGSTLEAASAASGSVVSAVSLTWTIVWGLFALLVLATVAIVAGLRNSGAFKKFMRIVLFFLAVLLGWMGGDAKAIVVTEDAIPSGADAKSPYSATLAGYIVCFVAMFGMAIAALLALNADDAPPAPVAQASNASAYVNTAHKNPAAEFQAPPGAPPPPPPPPQYAPPATGV